MKIHYFQRYHEKENVATANTMLLLSRLYQYSPEKFYQFLNALLGENEFEITMQLQVRNNTGDSIPDAVISQRGFKIIIEAKLYDWFHDDQLIRHLNSFGDEESKYLITLASDLMEPNKKMQFENRLQKYNQEHKTHVIHINTTFEKIVFIIQDIIDDRTGNMQEILDDFIDFCYTSQLIIGANAWKTLRVKSAGITYSFNTAEGVFYDPADRGFREHDYLGLYQDKAVRYIGKITAQILAVEKDGELTYQAEKGELTNELKEKIKKAIEDAAQYGWYDLKYVKHRYFFVDHFYNTEYKKISKGASRGTRYFDLEEVLNMKQMPATSRIAELLASRTWI